MALLFTFALVLGSWTAGRAIAQSPGEPLEIPEKLAAVLHARSPSSIGDLRQIQSQVQKVVERGLPATVGVQVGRAAGSGVIISDDGLVLTVAHVIGRAGRRGWVLLPDGQRFRARSLGANHDGDAGMMQIEDPPDDLPFTPVATQERLEVGEWVVTIGQPGGIISGRAPPVRLGRVLNNRGRYVRTDCALVGGDSGGPLLNMRGEVVGIHSSIGMSLTQNFHVPVSTFREGWDRMLASEVWGGRSGDDDVDERSFYPVLGVVGNVDDEVCVVRQVLPDFPAANAGVQQGDVVTAVNGDPVENFAKLIEIIKTQRPRRRIRLTIQRDAETVEIRVRLAGIDQPLPGGPEWSPSRDDDGDRPQRNDSNRERPETE